MATNPAMANLPGYRTPVPVRTITKADLDASLREGYQDFLSKRGDLIFVGMLYPLIGLIAATFALNGASLPLLFPLVAGLSLMGPLVSAGFYELARRRDIGEDSGWGHFFDMRKANNFSDFAFVGAILLGIFAAWMVSAVILHNVFLGDMLPRSIGDFLAQLLTTPEGWAMIVIGNLVGLFFAVLTLAVSFVTLPMLVDRNVGAGRALRTSVRAYRANRVMSLRWGLRVAALLALGSIPLFLGLAVVLPILGYATYHLYTRLIDRSALEPAQRDG